MRRASSFFINFEFFRVRVCKCIPNWGCVRHPYAYVNECMQEINTAQMCFVYVARSVALNPFLFNLYKFKQSRMQASRQTHSRRYFLRFFRSANNSTQLSKVIRIIHHIKYNANIHGYADWWSISMRCVWYDKRAYTQPVREMMYDLAYIRCTTHLGRSIGVSAAR